MDVKQTATERLLYALFRQTHDETMDVGFSKLVQDVENNVYHDFDSEHPYPKAELAKELQVFGFGDLAKRVEDGEFDEGPEEAEKWWSTKGKALLVEYEKKMDPDNEGGK